MIPITDRSSRPPAIPQREIHVKDLLAVVRRHWLLVIVLSALVGGGAWFAGRNAIPQFQSRLTVQINSPKQVFARLDDIDVDELALRTDPILSEALFLTTHELALRVAVGLGLPLVVTDPNHYRGDVFAAVAVDTATARTGVYRLVRRGADGYDLLNGAGESLARASYEAPAAGPGFTVVVQPTTNRDTVDLRLISAEEAATWVTGGLSYSVRPSTNAVDITYTSTDPTLVPVTLNRAAAELRNDGARRAGEIARQRRLYILEQTQNADSSFQAKLRELQGYKESQLITDLTAAERAVVETIQRLEQERSLVLVQISTIRDAMAGEDSISLSSLHELAAIDGLSANSALSFQIQNLLELYEQRRTLTAGAMGLRANNPRVAAIDQRLAEGHASLARAVEASLRSLAARRTALQDKIAEQQQILSTFPGKETRIAQLELEAQIINETYRYLLGQYEAARLQEATIAPYVDILDGSSRAVPIGTSGRQKVVLGLLVGFLLGLAGAFFLEYLDQTLKSAGDIERVLAVPVLGMVPHDLKLRTTKGGRALITVDRLDASHPAAEAYRAIRTNVTFVGAEKPVQYIALTSPGPREGKSTTTINLAVALAQGGRRTILIDGDLRRPQVHRSFSLGQTPGLTDILIGAASPEEAIQRDVHQQLDVLPSGPTPPNPSELLGSNSMRKLIDQLREHYEFIIMDTPPTLPVTDAVVVSTIADATILVVRSGDTEESAGRRAIDQLRRVRARVAGAVLNGVTPRRDRQYSYYSYGRTPRERSGLGRLKTKFASLL